MLVEKQDNICFTCHSDLAEDIQNGKSKHSPVLAGECTKCHSPHKSKISKLLLAVSPDLCLNCHQDLKIKIEKEKVHPPAASDCLRCHKPHASSEPSLIVQPLHSLCGECHDLKGISFNKAHIGIDATIINCISCHTPHASKDPKLFKDNIHPPFAARSCDECHVVEK
jgi:predicted CXXCH cytochrome family protein